MQDLSLSLLNIQGFHKYQAIFKLYLVKSKVMQIYEVTTHFSSYA